MLRGARPGCVALVLAALALVLAAVGRLAGWLVGWLAGWKGVLPLQWRDLCSLK